eukprot:3790389-Pyramimonas_sp.AAC.1
MVLSIPSVSVVLNRRTIASLIQFQGDLYAKLPAEDGQAARGNLPEGRHKRWSDCGGAARGGRGLNPSELRRHRSFGDVEDSSTPRSLT